MLKTTTRKQTPASIKPCLEALEERCLLDANPQSQLAVDLAKLGVAELRVFVDGAVIADGAAAAAGAEFPPVTAGAIATLVALKPVIDNPAMAYDLASFLQDYNEGNIAGMLADATGFVDSAFLAFSGDLVAFQQAGAAVAKDLSNILQAPASTQTQPSSTSSTFTTVESPGGSHLTYASPASELGAGNGPGAGVFVGSSALTLNK